MGGGNARFFNPSNLKLFKLFYVFASNVFKCAVK